MSRGVYGQPEAMREGIGTCRGKGGLLSMAWHSMAKELQTLKLGRGRTKETHSVGWDRG